jgi:heptosyltransferase-2
MGVAEAKILVRATNWLGDAVMSLPALRALRVRFGGAHMTVLARGWVAELYRRERCVDEVITAPENWRGRIRLGAMLRRRGFDCAVVFPNSFESAVVPWLARIPRRIGYERDRRGMLLTDAVARPQAGEIPSHERFYYLELLRRAGVIDCLPAEAPVLLDRAAEARTRGRELFAAMRFAVPVVGISPGAQNSRAKQWLPERFVDCALRVAAVLAGGVVLFGSARERPLCQTMAEAVRREGFPVLNLAGETTLGKFVELAAACRVFLTNDSGAMHVASALAVPTVAVFGPTEYFATSPAGPLSAMVREAVDCSPCMLRDCPIDHRCMTGISAERVAETALELLK